MSWVPIRILSIQHRPRISAHLKCLGPQDRYLRFGYTATDEQIENYVNKLNFVRDDIYGVFNRRLEIVAMAHEAGALTMVDATQSVPHMPVDATAIGKEIDFVLTVKVNVTTLCPCSKAISQYGAHNQRGEVTVQIRSTKAIWIEDLIAIVEKSASSELYALLKRQDEKAVTERAYENPVFVEDLVRNVAQRLNARRDVTWYKVEAENYESIHNHNAYACIEKG